MTTRASPPARSGRRAAVLKKAVIAVVVLAGVGGGGAWVWATQAAEADARGRAATTSDTAAATVLSFDITTIATGELAAKNQVEVRNKLDTMSSIVEIVAEGTRVQKGDLLVRLNSDKLETEIDQQRLQVESSRADLIAAENDLKNQEDENDSNLRKADLKLALAELALQQWEQGELSIKLTELEQAVRRATRDLDRLQDKVARSELLYKKDFLSKDELELDRIAFEEARAKLTTTELDVTTYRTYQEPRDRKQKESDVTEARAERERTIRSNEIHLINKRAKLENARQQLKLREEKLAKLESQLALCVIEAPTEGLVVYGSSLNAEWFFDSRGPMRIGRDVAPNDLIIVLPDTSEMIAKVKVHESLAGRVRPGLPVDLKVEAVGNASFSGRVDAIGVLAESSGWRDPNRREYSVTIALDAGQQDDLLKPSMRAEAEIRLGRVEDALAVPLQAVFNDGPVRFVHVPQGGKYAKRPIQVGRRSDAYAEITAGVSKGERVLIRRPTPAEVLDTPWDPKQLEVAGLRLNERGEPVPIAPPGAPAGAVEFAGAPPGAEPAADMVVIPAGAVLIEAAPAGGTQNSAAIADNEAAADAPALDTDPDTVTAAESPGADEPESEPAPASDGSVSAAAPESEGSR